MVELTSWDWAYSEDWTGLTLSTTIAWDLTDLSLDMRVWVITQQLLDRWHEGATVELPSGHTAKIVLLTPERLHLLLNYRQDVCAVGSHA